MCIDEANTNGAQPSTGEVNSKKQNCDRGTLSIGVKMSKIATLIPNKGTIKGTIKNAKRKRLFTKKQNKETSSGPE